MPAVTAQKKTVNTYSNRNLSNISSAIKSKNTNSGDNATTCNNINITSKINDKNEISSSTINHTMLVLMLRHLRLSCRVLGRKDEEHLHTRGNAALGPRPNT